MEDPGALAKKLQMEKSAAKNLALTYGPKEDRLALERQATQLAHNLKANVSSTVRVETAKQITNWVLETYDCTTECLRIQDPKDASRSMRLTPTCLWLWGRGIMDGDPGIDLDNPPITDKFVLEAVVLGLNKGVVAATLDSRSQAGTSKSTKCGVSKSTKGGASKSPKSRENSNGQGPKDPEYDSKRRKQVFTPMQILPNNRVMAPWSIKAVEAEARRPAAAAKKTPTAPRESSPDSNHSSEPQDEEDLALPPPLNFDDEEEATTTSPKVAPKAGHATNPLELSDDELSSTGSKSAPLPCQRVASRQQTVASPPASRHQTVASPPHTSDVEMPGLAAQLGVHRLPVRKAARSPAGDGVHNEFSRLSVEQKRGASPSLTCKQPVSHVSLTRTSDQATNECLGNKSQLNSSLAPTSLRVNSSLPSDVLPKGPAYQRGPQADFGGIPQAMQLLLG
ncbi:hypothetical protein PCASD_25655 [Puccinia coronata f. sp. avenae]|uniref:Uncharacterized protein n=1 Tax=Puccinia coronata f. sp. avenae TaxID=200324 RepID=A0A2N5S906_9BASI|nr:hypothetical protein PCASD_25655 [Puccinia coronata f. sp. avenae]